MGIIGLLIFKPYSSIAPDLISTTVLLSSEESNNVTAPQIVKPIDVKSPCSPDKTFCMFRVLRSIRTTALVEEGVPEYCTHKPYSSLSQPVHRSTKSPLNVASCPRLITCPVSMTIRTRVLVTLSRPYTSPSRVTLRPITSLTVFGSCSPVIAHRALAELSTRSFVIAHIGTDPVGWL